MCCRLETLQFDFESFARHEVEQTCEYYPIYVL